MNGPHTILSDFPKSELQLLADGQRKLIRQREARGVPVDWRSIENLRRLEVELVKAA